jgi:hypothetical protein
VDGDLVICSDPQFVGGSGRFTRANGSGTIDAIGHLSRGLPFEGTIHGTTDY